MWGVFTHKLCSNLYNDLPGIMKFFHLEKAANGNIKQKNTGAETRQASSFAEQFNCHCGRS